MNRYKITFFVLFSFLFITSRNGNSLEIPLTSGTSEGGGSGGKIGYVDMQKIFQLYPQTLEAKDDYNKQLKAKQDSLALKEQELASIKTKIAILESTIPAAPNSTTEGNTASTETVNSSSASVPQALPDLKSELETRKQEYEEAHKRAFEELNAFENKQSQLILGKIYKALRDLAEEEQITVVVDKSSILYGSGEIDLTDKLQTKVRGY